MAGLDKTLAAIPAGSTRREYGTAYFSGSKWYANIRGSLLTARWDNQMQPLQGMAIAVDLTKDEAGQSTALVICGYLDQPRPSTGTVLTVGVTEIVFTGEDGTTYTTDRFIGSYSFGDLIFIDWSAGLPTIIGVIPTITVTPPTPPPPPPPVTHTGSTTLIASASDTWGVGGWGRWATSQAGGEDIYTGTWGGYTLTGAWFYGTPKPELAGKTITRVQFRFPQRLSVGASGAATIHLYAHTSQSRPGGDVSRTVGPFDVSIPQGSPPKWVDLPTSFGAVLAAGGGISIAGNPYAGFASRLDDAESGKILIDWST